MAIEQRKFLIISFLTIIQLFSLIRSDPSIEFISESDISKRFNSNFFGGRKDSDTPNENSIFDPNECLVSKSEAKTIIKEKYGSSYTGTIDENMRFILGKCNPVLFVPGIYATRLVATINCKKFIQEDFNQFIHARVFCGDSICKDENNEHEEHVIFPALFDSPFTLRVSDDNKHSACLGYFMKFFNKKDECPKMDDGEPICNYSDAVRITYYGGTENTEAKAQCGLSAVKNVVSTGSTIVPEAVVNSGSAKVFKEMISNFHSMGYREGFSYGAVPIDYRQYVSSNEFMKEGLKYQVEQLYENTGKPVVLIGHSFGNLNILHQLVDGDEELLKKIKKFVAIAPPFAGASKLLDVFLTGSHDFDTTISIIGFDILKVKYDPFGQSIAYNSIPLLAELRPLPIFSQLFKQSKYKKFAEAINNIYKVEKECKDKVCSESEIDSLTKTFKEVYGDILPSYADSECKLNTNDIYYVNPCRSELYDNVNCPAMVLEDKEQFIIDSSTMENYCGLYNSSILYQDICQNSFKAFLSTYDDTPSCIDSIYNNPPYPYAKPTMDEFINNFNSKFSKKYNIELNHTFFENETTFSKRMTKLIEYHSKISKTSSLPIPPIDTVVLYSNFVPTSTSFVYDQDKNKEQFASNEIYYKGGDGTVPNWSSYLTGLKWLYDKKENSLPQNITLIEYCSPLAKPGGKYAYSKNTSKAFFGIGCDCINDDYGSYDSKKLSNGECMHSTMISDSVVINYIRDEVLRSDLNQEVTEGTKKAVEEYDSGKKFEQICNTNLRRIVESDMD